MGLALFDKKSNCKFATRFVAEEEVARKAHVNVWRYGDIGADDDDDDYPSFGTNNKWAMLQLFSHFHALLSCICILQKWMRLGSRRNSVIPERITLYCVQVYVSCSISTRSFEQQWLLFVISFGWNALQEEPGKEVDAAEKARYFLRCSPILSVLRVYSYAGRLALHSLGLSFVETAYFVLWKRGSLVEGNRNLFYVSREMQQK